MCVCVCVCVCVYCIIKFIYSLLVVSSFAMDCVKKGLTMTTYTGTSIYKDCKLNHFYYTYVLMYYKTNVKITKNLCCHVPQATVPNVPQVNVHLFTTD